MIGFHETRHGQEIIEVQGRVAVAVMTAVGVSQTSLLGERVW